MQNNEGKTGEKAIFDIAAAFAQFLDDMDKKKEERIVKNNEGKQ